MVALSMLLPLLVYVVAVIAQRLMICLVPKQNYVTTVALDVIHNGCHQCASLATHHAERVACKEVQTIPTPPSVIATLVCALAYWLYRCAWLPTWMQPVFQSW